MRSGFLEEFWKRTKGDKTQKDKGGLGRERKKKKSVPAAEEKKIRKPRAREKR